MRKYIAVLAVLLFCSQATATEYYRVHEPLATTTGEAITGASYWFYTPGTTDTVAVYSDATGTRSYHGDGFETGADGMIDKYVIAGTYDIGWSHSPWSLSGTLTNYSYGVASEVSMEGTVEAWAFDAEDRIDAGSVVSSATLETSGATALGGTVTTGGTVDIGGGLDVEDAARFAWDEANEVYSFRVSPLVISIEPHMEIHDDVYVYANLLLFGKDSTSGRVQAQTAECDTLKPRTGRHLYARAADGQNDGILHGQFLQLNPVDISISLPDTTDYDVGTLMFCSDDSFRYLAGAGIAKEWRTLGYAGYVAGEDNPELYLPTTTLNFTYADSTPKEFTVDNTGEGILTWTSANISTWIHDDDEGFEGLHHGVNDTGLIGTGIDTIDVELMWAQIDSGVSLYDTVAVTSDYGNSQVIIHADGKPLVGGGDYVVEPNHPRLFFNEDEVAGIRAKCRSAEATFYDGFKDWVDDYALGDTYPFAYNYQHGAQLRRLAFAYIVEQDTTYLQEAVECADSLFAGFPTTWYDDDDVQTGLALFYDWCYDGFGATRKSKFGDSLAVACSRAHADASYSTNAAHSQIVVMSDLMYMALALAGDGLDDAGATATRRYSSPSGRAPQGVSGTPCGMVSPRGGCAVEIPPHWPASRRRNASSRRGPGTRRSPALGCCSAHSSARMRGTQRGGTGTPRRIVWPTSPNR